MNWLETPIGDLVTIRGGGTPERSNDAFFQGDIPWVTPKDMKAWEITNSQIKITPEAVEQSATNLVPTDTVLLVVRSGVLKHTAPIAINRRPVAINQDMKSLECNGRLLPEFLARFLKESEPVILGWVRATTADNYSVDNIRKLRIPVPPVDEQRRIAAILDQADDLRRKRRETLGRLNEMSEAIFVEMFGPGNAALSTSPLGKHLSFVTSGGRNWSRYYTSAGCRFIRSLDVQMNHIGDEGIVFVNPPRNAEARRTRVEAGDVLLTITGSRIGRVATAPKELEGSYISQHVAILRVDQSSILPHYLSFFLSLNGGGQRQIAKAQYGQTKPGLNFEQIRRFLIPVPPVTQQQAFIRCLDSIETLHHSIEDHANNLDALFASLQHRAFRGEL